MRYLLLLLLFLLLNGSAHARLGETKEQLMSRWGEPDVQPVQCFGSSMLLFHESGLAVGVLLVNGHSVREIYYKPSGAKITDEERQKLFNANGTGWGSPQLGLILIWRDKNGSIAKYRGNGNPTYEFDSKEYLELEAHSKAPITFGGFPPP